MTEETPRRVSAWSLLGAAAVVLLLVIVAIVLTAVVWKAFGLNSGAPAAIAIIAEIVLVPVIVWLVLYFGILRGRQTGAVLSFVVLLGTSIVFFGGLGGLFAYLGHHDREANVRIAAAATARDLKLVIDSAVMSVQSLSREHEAVSLRTSLPGPSGEIARGAKAMMFEVMHARGVFDKATDALNYPELMLAENLAAGDHLEKAPALLARVRAV